MNAAGAWCDTAGRMAGSQLIGLVPKRRTAFTFAPPADTAHDTWPMVIDIEEQFYFRPEGPQVLAPPCDESRRWNSHDVRHEEIDVALGISKIEAGHDDQHPIGGARMGGIALVRHRSPSGEGVGS